MYMLVKGIRYVQVRREKLALMVCETNSTTTLANFAGYSPLSVVHQVWPCIVDTLCMLFNLL